MNRKKAEAVIQELYERSGERLKALEKEFPDDGRFKSYMELRGITRRDFLKWTTAITATLMLPPRFQGRVAQAAELATRIPVVWLHFQECAGCSESFLRSANPDVATLITEYLSVEYHETIMAPSGDYAEKSLDDAIKKYKGKYICIIEGAIPTKGEGYFFSGAKGESALSKAKRVTKNASLVIAFGTCSSYGGVQAAEPNPTGAKGVKDALGIDVVNIPGCPGKPENLVGTIIYYLLFGFLPKLKNGRPYFAFGKRVHDTCPRRAHFDAGEFVEEWGDEAHKRGFCLYKMGCKGPVTYHNCNIIEWNEDVSSPIKSGHGCIGCVEPYFWDRMAPYEEPLPRGEVGVFGIERDADALGLVLFLASAVGMGLHLAYSYLKSKTKED